MKETIGDYTFILTLISIGVLSVLAFTDRVEPEVLVAFLAGAGVPMAGRFAKAGPK